MSGRQFESLCRESHVSCFLSDKIYAPPRRRFFKRTERIHQARKQHRTGDGFSTCSDFTKMWLVINNPFAFLIKVSNKAVLPIQKKAKPSRYQKRDDLKPLRLKTIKIKSNFYSEVQRTIKDIYGICVKGFNPDLCKKGQYEAREFCSEDFGALSLAFGRPGIFFQ